MHTLLVLIASVLLTCQLSSAWHLNLNCGGLTPFDPNLPRYYDGVTYPGYANGVVYAPGNAVEMDGELFVPDGFYSGFSTHVLERPGAPGVFGTERYGLLVEYNFKLPSASGILITLYFMENQEAFRAPGARVFNVKFDGQEVIHALDIAASVGFQQPLVITKQWTLQGNGLLTISLESVNYEGLINAIRVASADCPPGSNCGGVPPPPNGLNLGNQGKGSKLQVVENLVLGDYAISVDFASGQSGQKIDVYFDFKPIVQAWDVSSGGTVEASFSVTNALLRIEVVTNFGDVEITAIRATQKPSPGIYFSADCGSPIDVLDGSGIIFKADNSVSGGQPFPPPQVNPYGVWYNSPPNVSPLPYYWSDFILTTYREGVNFEYKFMGVPNGNWIADLYFADPSSTGIGQRVMDIYVQGKPALQNFDPFAASGGQNFAVVRQVAGPVTDQTFSISLSGKSGAALISAIFGHPDVVSGGSPNPDPIPTRVPNPPNPSGGGQVSPNAAPGGGAVCIGGNGQPVYMPKDIPGFSGKYSFAVNAGGPSYLSSWGVQFVADDTPCLVGPGAPDTGLIPSGSPWCRTNIVKVDGGYNYVTNTPISGLQNSADQVIYQSERIGWNTFKFSVTQGKVYAIVGYFAEISGLGVPTSVTEAGQRIFNVVYWDTLDTPEQKNVIISQFDQLSAACMQQFRATPPVQGITSPVQSNVLSIQFQPAGGRDAPVVKGLWIYEV